MQLPSPSDPIESQLDSGASDSGAKDSGARDPGAPAPSGEQRPEHGRAAGRTPDSGRRVAPLRMAATRFDVILVALTALVATVLGRAVAPALPGSGAGIGSLISGIDQLAGFTTQFMAVMGVSTCVRLLLTTLDSPSRSFRSMAILTTTTALPMVISASSRHLAPGWLIALVGLSAALGVT